MATDDYGQNIPYPLLNDKPNAQTGFGDLANALTKKSNMVFANANARAASLPNPVDGMETYLVAEQRKDIRVNGAWQAAVLATLPWANVSLAGPYSAWIGATVGPRVRREGSIVYLEGRLMRTDGANIPVSDSLTLGTIPSAYRPAGHYVEGVVAITNTGAGAPVGRIEITTGGVINFFSDKPTNWVGFSNWWFVN